MIKEKDNCQGSNMVKDESRNLFSLNDAVQELKKAKPNELVIFVGAGISKDHPSSCPLSKDLMGRAIDSAKKAHRGLADFHSFINCRTKRIKKPELFCQILHSNLREDFFAFLDILNMGMPNSNHLNIAYIASEYKTPIILTTNFDTYIEKALDTLDKVGFKYKLHVNFAPRRLRKSLNNKGPEEIYLPLVKLHGTLDERASIIFTLRLAGRRLKKDLSELIRTAFTTYTVLLVGYSGNDDDIFPVILSSAKSAKGVYWLLRNNEGSLTKNIETFGDKCPNCRLVGADGRDIFARLLDKDGDEKYDQGKEDEYLFSWDSVPGDDNDKLIRFLMDDFDIDLAENAEIRKSHDGMTISISEDENSAEIIMNEQKEKAILKISDCITFDLKVKTENGKLNIYKNKMETHQNKFLRIWASGINEMAWKNFFSEIILLFDPTKDEATFIAEQSNKIIRQSDDPWLVTKALKNHGLALAVLKEYKKAVESLSKAAEKYMTMGRHREAIECLSMMVANVPIESERMRFDPLFWTSWLSGKTYDSYCLGLSNYAAGLHFLRNGRTEVAQKRLLVAAGYAKQCGDSVTVVNCLESLGKVFNRTKEKGREKECIKEANRIKNELLGVDESNVKGEKSKIIDKCESAFKKEKRLLIGGEIGFFIGISVISGLLAWIWTPWAWIMAISYGVGKIWNVIKKFRYTGIDRT